MKNSFITSNCNWQTLTCALIFPHLGELIWGRLYITPIESISWALNSSIHVIETTHYSFPFISFPYFVLEVSRFLCFYKIHKCQNLWRHHRHCCIMEVTLAYFFWILNTIKMKVGQMLVYFIWAFLTVFESMLETGN